MINFDEKTSPDKVFLGYMCYEVRPYVPLPLTCFQCQKFGHVAALCKGKQRGGRCSGDHEHGKCGARTKLKCCKYGGGHSSAHRGCEANKRAMEVQRIKVPPGVTSAEAVEKVSGKEMRMGADKNCVAPLEDCHNIKTHLLLGKKCLCSLW